MITRQGPINVGTGTDNIGANLINYMLYSSAYVDFSKTRVTIQSGQPSITQVFASSEPISLITSRSVAPAVAYILFLLFVV